MFISASDLSNLSRTIDVVTVGAGAAGIALARALDAAGLTVLLVEGGGLETSDESQQLYDGTYSGLPYSLLGSRARYFGGTTNHWSGWVRPLDPDDFSSWPISAEALAPYLADALTLLDIDPTAVWQPPSNSTVATPLPADSGFDEVYWQFSRPPTRFASKYQPELTEARNVLVLLNHTLSDLIFGEGGKVEAAEFLPTTGGDPILVSARTFVLAMGGIEIPRVLLYFNARHGTNYGNQSGELGRNFMEHPHITLGDVVVTDRAYIHTEGQRFFRPGTQFRAEYGVLGAGIRFNLFADPEFNRDVRDELAEITRLPNNGWRGGSLFAASEQAPDPSNRITLTSATDALGIPKPDLHLNLTALDIETLRVIALQFAYTMLRANLGRCRLQPWVYDPTLAVAPDYWGNHHMGATRMAGAERGGVVDSDCRVFGTQNLYIAGSSVFPTGGYANPTLTILQLTLRLADHLIGQFLI